MTNKRTPYSPAEELSLTTQVGGHCPLCDGRLFYTKKGKTYKSYDLAHIYPLNPKPAELLVLTGAERLHADVNHPDNIIPLCDTCHARFDKPRTREEYDELIARKRALIIAERQRGLFAAYPVEAELRLVIDRLLTTDVAGDDDVELEYDAKSLEAKFDATLPAPTRQKIRHAVADYYSSVRAAFREVERTNPNSSQVIFSQVRSFYLKQKTVDATQPATFRAVVDWIRSRTQTPNAESAEILASFFVQNCEVFE